MRKRKIQVKNSLIKKTEDMGLKYRFYTYKDQISTLFTTCLLFEGEKLVARGVSICSLSERYLSQKGYNKSLGRAIKAYKSKQSYFPINKDREDNLYVQRKFKLDKDKAKDFEDKLMSSISHLPSFSRSDFIMMSEKDKDENKVSVRFTIPYFYPLLMASKFFSYKSEFSPTMHDYEKSWIDSKKRARK